MKNKKIKYFRGNMGKMMIMGDFLPKPEELILREKKTKRTLIQK